MKVTNRNRLLVALAVLVLPVALGQGLTMGPTTCEMSFEMTAWSKAYGMAHGVGTITCDNGQSAEVRVRLKVDEPVFTETHGVRARASFSPVAAIEELFGPYGVTPRSRSTEVDSMVALAKGDIALSIHGVDAAQPVADLARGHLSISLRRPIE